MLTEVWRTVTECYDRSSKQGGSDSGTSSNGVKGCGGEYCVIER